VISGQVITVQEICAEKSAAFGKAICLTRSRSDQARARPSQRQNPMTFRQFLAFVTGVGAAIVKIYEWRQDVIYGPYLAKQRSPNVLPCHQMPSHRWRTSAPIDQMKFFELIQIVPSPIRSALKSPGQLSNSRPDHHEISTEQQHLRLWTGRQGESICDRSRNS
jgi:hypothetical protein